MGHALTVDSSRAQLRPDTDLATIEPVLDAVAGRKRRLFLQFDEPLPDPVLAAAAAALKRHSEVIFRVYGRAVDSSLSWLAQFEHVEHLQLDLWQATSFDVLASFKNLRSLHLGETATAGPSLAFLRELSHLTVLWLEAHARDFEAIADVRGLVRLGLRVPRLKSLDPLRGHPGIQAFKMDFGGIRDLSPLADMPRLRGLQLYQVRGLDADDMDALGDCGTLEALSLGALRNVSSLRYLARRPAQTLRLLNLEKLAGLGTLADLSRCEQLEQLGLYEARPADKRLDVLLRIPTLRHLVIGDVYPPQQVKAMRDSFGGDTLICRRETVRGELSNVAVRWRQQVHPFLGID